MTPQIISAPRGECGMGSLSAAWLRGMNADRSIAISAITQMTAATQKIGSASECVNLSV
ncbi:MAG TPA: hypothetical protein VHM24_14070 [Gemmatimonadaceae bacterium]|nr:hypothetical protein [Gemmatimonadaceae bacterium]